MFSELMPLLSKRRLLLTISLVEGDTIRATVVPQKASDTEDNAVTTPLAITGTEPSPASKKALQSLGGLRNPEPLGGASPRSANPFHRLHHPLHFFGRHGLVIRMDNPVSQVPNELKFCHQGQADDSTGSYIRDQLSSSTLFPAQRPPVHPARRDVQQALIFLCCDLAGNHITRDQHPIYSTLSGQFSNALHSLYSLPA